MREIHVDEIINAVEKLCINANYYLNNDIECGLEKSAAQEKSPIGRDILEKLVDNAKLAREANMPICQDTGMAVVFIEVGQDTHVTGGSITEAINEGVRRGYKEGYLRNSVVRDPINRVNTGDNTPAIIHYDMVQGDKIKITVAPKGFGSENMSGLKMLKPSDGIEGVKNFILSTIDQAGANPCPPMIIGVGLGGTMEKAAYLAKKALLRPIDQHNKDEYYNNLELELLDRINGLGIGPQGLGGTTTALAVNVEVYPTHIAGLPVAVNVSCHATRHAETAI
ncbi:fumarate hydratase [Petroclostridium sp. X23]|uniref:fumarate hydratase n=1 Tax=Petroclostridium sp. X23 TaxID=3045146 RepID=UPI0024AC9FEA|nr:fumarate hydratase [Petroclostridium sp. X23]WHH57525.1 fumarate hydratase [Petroclostridium sp. X23]